MTAECRPVHAGRRHLRGVRAGRGLGESRYELEQAAAAVAADYWDGRRRATRSSSSCCAHAIARRGPRPHADPRRDAHREEPARGGARAPRLAARGLALLAAMRSTEPGAWEYQLDAAARYVFQLNGARLDAYRSITASGTENINNGHYCATPGRCRGDLVLMDYAPDYRYYVSDVTRCGRQRHVPALAARAAPVRAPSTAMP